MSVVTLLLSITVSAQLTPSADPGPIPIAGVVVDPSGNPAPDVGVWMIDSLPPSVYRWFGDELSWMELSSKRGVGLPPVCLETRTDSAGKFALEVSAEFAARHWQSPLALVAIRPGNGLAIKRLPVPMSLERTRVNVALAAPERTVIRVLDPAGKPVAGATVLPSEIDDVPIPDAPGRQLGGTSDSEGRVVLASVPRSLLREILVDAPRLGKQRIRIEPVHVAEIRLAPVGRFVGLLTAPANQPIQGVTVRASTLVDGYEGSGHGGLAEVTRDASGRFEIPAIAAGMLTLEIVFDPWSDMGLRTEPYRGIVLAAGTSTELTIPLRPTVKITGSFREQGTTRPIAGILVALNGMFGGDHFAVTNAGGNFQGFITRENSQPYGWAVRVPDPFFRPSVSKETPQRMPLPGTDLLVMPTVEQPRGVDVPGTVVDEAGHGVAGATVEATWRHGTGRTQFVISRADARGRFALHGVDPVAELTYRASLGDSCTLGKTTAQVEVALTKPVVLTITPSGTSTLVGRVIDTAGSPISGASVRIWRLGRGKDRRVMDLEPIMSENGRVAVRTDSDGRYRAPRRVSLPDEFFAEVMAPGRLSTRSRSVLITDQATEIPPVTLPLVRALAGQVVDRQGQPVGDALVQQAGDGPMPTSATTDAQGRFRLPGVLEGPAIIVVRKPGFRTEPHSLAGREQFPKLVLTRTGDPGSVTYKTLPPSVSAVEEAALIQRLVPPLATRVLKDGTADDKRQMLRRLAEIDPGWVLDHLGSVKFTDPDDLDRVRGNIAGALLRDNADEAAAVIESIHDPAWRAFVYANSGRDLLKRDPVRARQYLEQAILNYKLTSPTVQFLPAGEIVGLLVDLGEVERARELLKTERKRIESQSVTARQRSVLLSTQVLVPLARIDPAAALAELETLRRDRERESKAPSTMAYQSSRIAVDLADRSPADAERLLRRVWSSASFARTVDEHLLAVCWRMASRDLPRARSLTNLISDGQIELKAFALGLMAKSLASSDRATALQLIDEAYTELDRLRARGRISQFASIAVVAGGLLPIVEEIDAGRLPEFLARAILLRPPQAEWDYGSWIPDQTAQLAMMVARYDRKLGAQLIQPDLDRLGKPALSFGGADLRTNFTLCTLALIDPFRAAGLIEGLPESPTLGLGGGVGTKHYIIVDAAKLLSLHGDNRWRHVYERFLLLWTPDQEVR